MMHPLIIFLICVCSLAVICALAFLFHYCNSALQITHYSEECRSASNGELKICQISDLHAKEFGIGNCKLLKAIKQLSPDVIVITGDIIHKYRPRDKQTAVAFVSEAAKISTVLFVSGNHEMRNTEYRTFAKSLAKAGAVVLDNSHFDVNGVRFCGLNCAHLKNATVYSLEKSCGYNVLLAHKPEFFYAYSRAGFDLVLSGHAHGGQWRLPVSKRGIYSPGQGLFPKYTSGTYTSGNSKMIVSRGLGNSQFPLRLFNRPEIVLITLTKNEKEIL